MSSARPASVLVFDSGVGGLSVLQHIQQQLPALMTHYVMDDAWCPYGERDQSELVSRIVSVTESAIEACQPDALIVACNTASTLALSQLRNTLSIPVVGVVPALKPAAEVGNSGAIVLLATSATVNGDYVASLWKEFGEGKSLVTMACPELVVLAESKLSGESLKLATLRLWRDRLQEQLRELEVASVSAFVLGCTHFPLLRDELMEAWDKPALWLDSGAAVARRVAVVLQDDQRFTSTLIDAHVKTDPEPHKGSWWRTDSHPCRKREQTMADYGLSAAGCLTIEVSVNSDGTTQ